MKTVSLINMKGGVGKSTLAINIADCLADRHGKRVLLVDIDPQFNATQCLMSPDSYIDYLKDEKDTILSLFDRKSRVLPSAVEGGEQRKLKSPSDVTPLKIKNNLYLLPGNLELYRLEMAPGEGRENRLKNFLQAINNEYDYVVLDTPPTPSVWMTSALIASDYYLIPVKADPISLTGVDLLKNIIEEKRDNFGLSLKCAGLVLTLTEENTKVYQDAKRNLEKDDYWNKHLFSANLPKRTEIARNQIDRRHILSGNNPEAKTSITRITTEFINKVESDEQH